MAAYQEKLPELESLGVSIYAASIDPLEYARQVVDRGITFPIAYRVTKEQAELVGAWWQDSLGFIEPAEFVLGHGGIVLGSMYASGAIGHTDVNDVIDLIHKRERRTYDSERCSPARLPA